MLVDHQNMISITLKDLSVRIQEMFNQGIPPESLLICSMEVRPPDYYSPALSDLLGKIF